MSVVNAVLTKVIGTKGERDVKRLQPQVDRINDLEPSVEVLSDERLRGRTAELRQQLAGGATLDDILPDAFAVAREASKRVLGMRHFDVQLVGGLVLHTGKIAEMKTGEGKTLVATLPVYLNALGSKGVHLVTVNDYLARRDAAWMGQLYEFLGLTVGTIQHDMDDEERRAAYAADVTYGTNNEYGFDYLRDNMKFSLQQMVQRGHHYAIVDEVDSILIDEARTPLIISGPAEDSTELYYQVDKVIPRLRRDDDYEIDEEHRTVTLTEDGVHTVERLLACDNLYDPANIDLLHHSQQALRAHTLFKLDVDYMIKDDQVVIVDEFTGRLMPGRRWSDGLHQAVEAKEGVKIERENQTLASITFQNYFRMYEKLAGMTGTADTESAEFQKIYELEVVVVPPNKPMIRADNPDLIYKTEEEKYEAVIKEIEELNRKGQPVLVGTISIEKSEELSRRLRHNGIRHVVLNAKYHEKEAEIVSDAGQKGVVTIATNMAGRGTDIVLGAGVIQLGGLHILGTERHDARRIDNQLRGRSGRQGDPGSSRFYLSLEDDLLRIFGGERMQRIMGRLGMEDGVPIESRLVSRQIESAQLRVEGQNFEIRKHLLEYDDIANKQRTEIYSLRRELLEGKGQNEYITKIAGDLLDSLVDTYANRDDDPNKWQLPELKQNLRHYFGIDVTAIDTARISSDEIREAAWKLVRARFDNKERTLGEEAMRHHERMLMLQIIDQAWKDHLYAMDHLKEGINLRAYGQQDPLVEYKRESFKMFGAMRERIETDIIRYIWLLEPQVQREPVRRPAMANLSYSSHADQTSPEGRKPKRRGKDGKVGRNAPCPCGSGKKYKMCCG